VRLHRLRDELGDRLQIEWRAFPLRPEPDPSVAYRGTFREVAWRRANAMVQGDASFTPWQRDDFPNWSLPALEAAKCVARQGDDAFERLHLRLYRAFFAEGRNIANRDEVVEVVRESGADLVRFLEDYRRGDARDEVMADYERAAVEHGVRAIPTIIVGRQRLMGLQELAEYRKAIDAEP
jgi:predicted DsbA family dithiol-disulfide isomerase